MPIFEYRCEECDFRFEELVLKEREIKCPRCGGKVKKLVSSFVARGGEGTGGSSCTSCTSTSCEGCGGG